MHYFITTILFTIIKIQRSYFIDILPRINPRKEKKRKKKINYNVSTFYELLQ